MHQPETILIISSFWVLILYKLAVRASDHQPRMAALLGAHTKFCFGLLGNIVSFFVYLAPIPTFYRIYKNKSTQEFQSIPYSVALFSAMLYLYYAFLKPDGFLLITINSFGILIESLYLIVFMIYATRNSKIFTTKLLILFNFGAFGLIVLFTYLFSADSERLAILGWICAVFSVSVFAAPLSIMKLVIRTKSVEFMPFSLSFCLTLCAVMWFLYGLSIHDYYIATPNILGLAFGVTQMILYLIYRERRNGVSPEVDLEEQARDDIPMSTVDRLPGDTPVNGEVDREIIQISNTM